MKIFIGGEEIKKKDEGLVVRDEYYCLDCGKRIEQPIPGILSGSLRTDGNKDIMKSHIGGIVYGKELGYVCNSCSIFGNKKSEIK